MRRQRVPALLTLVSTLLLSPACVTGSSKPTSQWSGLDSAGRVDCGNWPLRDGDLSVSQVQFLQGTPPGLISTGKLRDSSTVHYYTPFKESSDVDADDLGRVDIGRGSVILGSAKIGTKWFLAVAQRSKGKFNLELRGYGDNVVRFSAPGLPNSLQSGSIVNVTGGFWLSLKESEQSAYVMFVRQGKGSGRLEVVKFDDLSLTSIPVLLPVEGEPQVHVFTFDPQSAGQRKSDVFVLQTLSQDGKASRKSRLEIPLDSAVESWSIAEHKGKILLSWVDGDSMVGEAKMRIGEVAVTESSVNLSWDNQKPLTDVHVSEPMWLKGDDSVRGVILKWVDEESTLASYKVIAGTVSAPRFSGVFPKGSRLVDAFSDDDGDPWIIIRSKEKDRWNFQLCRLIGLK